MGGFKKTVLTPVLDANELIIDVLVKQPTSFEAQMLFYSNNYNFLGTEN